MERELNLGEIEAISKSFGYILNLAISGGEPFLRDDLDRICCTFYKNNHLQFMNIPTNGSMPEKIEFLTDKILKLCRKSTVAIELSLDGIGETHDFIRGVKGSFKKLEDTYKKLLKLKKKYSNLCLKVNTTFSYYNQNHMEEIVSYVKNNMTVDDFDIGMLHGQPRDNVAKRVSLDKYINLIRFLEQKEILGRKSIFGKVLFAVKKEVNQEVINVMRNGKLQSPCTAIRKIIVIDEAGNVFPCEIINEKIGNLREHNYDIKKIIYSKERCELEKKYKIPSECSCNWGCAIFNNVIYDARRIPSLIKNFIL